MITVHQREGAMLLATLLLVSIPWLQVPSYYMGFLITAFIFVILGEGWNIISGYTGYLDFGLVVWFGGGAYFMGILLYRSGVQPLITIPIGGLVMAAIAALTAYPLLRLRGIYFAIATLSLGYIAQQLVYIFDNITGGGVGLWLPFPRVGPREYQILFYYPTLFAVAATIYVAYRIEKSKFGLRLMAIRDDEDAAESVGINTTRQKVLVYSSSAFLYATAGGIYGYYQSYLSPEVILSLSITLTVVMATLLGGRGSYAGPVIGVPILILLSELLQTTIGSELNAVALGVAMVAIVLGLPAGIVGSMKAWRSRRVRSSDKRNITN